MLSIKSLIWYQTSTVEHENRCIEIEFVFATPSIRIAQVFVSIARGDWGVFNSTAKRVKHVTDPRLIAYTLLCSHSFT